MEIPSQSSETIKIPTAHYELQYVEWSQKDGDCVHKGLQFGKVYGWAHNIVVAERVALNFMQRMSGLATLTKEMADVAYPACILETRKTAPGLRLVDKWAVLIGGGRNHRMGLFDMVLIKDNHISIAGGITNAVKSVDLYLEQKNLKMEVEGKDYRSQFQLGNGALLGANYIKSVTPNLSFGGEVFWAGQHRKSGIGYAARYNTDKMIFGAYLAKIGIGAVSELMVVIHLDSSKVVWTANRGLLINNSDKVVFDNQGNVFLKRGDGVVWSTNKTGFECFEELLTLVLVVKGLNACFASAPETETQTGLRLKSEVGKWGLAVRCAAAAQGPLAEIERELEAIEINPEKEEWMSTITRSNRCGERRGLVDMLECLESEAIMGEDQGREPTDYNRRAQIFDSSSRVFQALKEKEKHTPHVIII
ncbi:hypothetical protein SO802_017331 [Lithocarpus litseifolius]|uniref:Quinolinate phosphoribosyltransferase [decarboxylating] n=1 Tax=Lithocarpus litseifolius TaxID=425828 RepID=A0AAW2D354_9ROSI